MKITNKHGLPDAFVRAVQNDKYSRGGADYSATDLLSSPRMVQLKRRHDDEIVEDVSERIWSLLGSAAHAVLERSNPANALTEERLHAELLGRTISGAADIYDGSGAIVDYKTTSVYTTIYGSRTEDWTRQLNIYAWLFRQAGFDVSRLAVVAIYRDWRESESQRNADYPRAAVEEIPIELWSEDAQRAYIEERLRLMIDAEELPDDDLPECTSEDMWERPQTFAVHKGTNVRAARVLNTREEAEQWIADQGQPSQYSIQVRPGSRARCERYCSVAEFCSQYRQYKEDA